MRLERKRGFYEKYIKRLLDIICALLAILVFCWLYAIIALVVRVKIGSPVLFKQPRPGIADPKTGKERIFNMYKFRTMTNERGADGELLPDAQRLTKTGLWLRKTSLDELPEAFSILKGDMSVIGPRPQLVRDMVFMTDSQRMRHTAKPGLSGLAQIRGRNAITWEEKLEWDLKYIKKVSFIGDLKLVLATAKSFFLNRNMHENVVIALDYGDALLENGQITKEQYDERQAYAKELLADFEKNRG